MQQDVIANVIGLKSATVTRQWFELLQIVNCEGDQNGASAGFGSSVGVGGAEIVATWAEASVIGSQFLNLDPVCGPCLTSFSEGCRTVA